MTEGEIDDCYLRILQEGPHDVRRHPERHGQVRFREGWKKAASGFRYKDKTLRNLTWDNLGNRLGWCFPDATPDRTDAAYEYMAGKYTQEKGRRQ